MSEKNFINQYETRAKQRNKSRPTIDKVLGEGKVEVSDIAMEEAIKDSEKMESMIQEETCKNYTEAIKIINAETKIKSENQISFEEGHRSRYIKLGNESLSRGGGYFVWIIKNIFDAVGARPKDDMLIKYGKKTLLKGNYYAKEAFQAFEMAKNKEGMKKALDAYIEKFVNCYIFNKGKGGGVSEIKDMAERAGIIITSEEWKTIAEKCMDKGLSGHRMKDAAEAFREAGIDTTGEKLFKTAVAKGKKITLKKAG